MKHSLWTRLVAVLMVVALLAGCGVKSPEKHAETVPTTTAAPTQPPQQEMPADELEDALRRMEYSALAAAFSLSEHTLTVDKGYLFNDQACIVDLDRDGTEEMIYGQDGMILSLAPERYVDCSYSQSGFTYYIDNEGTLYQSSSMNDSFSQEENGKWVWYDYISEWYSFRNGGKWETAFTFSGEASYPQLSVTDDGIGINVTYDFESPITCEFGGKIHGQDCTEAELKAHFEKIGLREVPRQVETLTVNTFDPVYTDSLLKGLDAHLSANFSDYSGSVTADVDSDGYEETLFLIPSFDDVWYDHADPGDEYGSFAKSAFTGALPQKTARTAVLVADLKGGQLEVQALCAMGEVRAPGKLLQRDGFLWLDDLAVTIPGAAPSGDNREILRYIATYMDCLGMGDCLLKTVDVTEFPGAEYLALYQQDGVWYLVIFILEDGGITPVYSSCRNDSAIYLVEHGGKQHLLYYAQQMYTTMGGSVYTGYDYDLIRIGTDGFAISADNLSVGYYDDDGDASDIANFFEKLNVYLIKIIILRDPFRLTGRMWPKAEDIDFGTVPQEPEQTQPETPQPDTTQEPVMGFVQINDPSSWLNLRTGPGTEHPRVLVDPNDPESFVRQALGSPVTVLETVETGDSANPVWLKVRITYADREIVGYSSKTYIRIPGE